MRWLEWLLILCYATGLGLMWWFHLPVRNILLFFVVYTVLTCVLLILFKFTRKPNPN